MDEYGIARNMPQDSQFSGRRYDSQFEIGEVFERENQWLFNKFDEALYQNAHPTTSVHVCRILFTQVETGTVTTTQ